MAEDHLSHAERVLNDIKENINLALENSYSDESKEVLKIMQELIYKAKVSTSMGEYYKHNKEQ